MAEDERTHTATACTWIKYLVDGVGSNSDPDLTRRGRRLEPEALAGAGPVAPSTCGIGPRYGREQQDEPTKSGAGS